jgi:hypothetical protein
MVAKLLYFAWFLKYINFAMSNICSEILQAIQQILTTVIPYHSLFIGLRVLWVHPGMRVYPSLLSEMSIVGSVW